MFKLFKTRKALLRISENELELMDLTTHKLVKKSSEQPFSKSGLIVDEFTIAETLLRELIILLYGKSTLVPVMDTVIHPKNQNNAALREIEKETIKELCRFNGIRKMVFIEPTEVINNQKALDLLSK